MAAATADESLYLRGKKITTFILYEAAIRMRDMEVGETLELTPDAYEAMDNDVSAWCRATGHK